MGAGAARPRQGAPGQHQLPGALGALDHGRWHTDHAEDQHHHAVQEKEPDDVGRRRRSDPRPGAVDDGVGSDRKRRQQGEGDRAPLERLEL